MHVCMYACMHVCMYACMYVRVCMYVCMYEQKDSEQKKAGTLADEGERGAKENRVDLEDALEWSPSDGQSASLGGGWWRRPEELLFSTPAKATVTCAATATTSLPGTKRTTATSEALDSPDHITTGSGGWTEEVSE